MKEISDREQAAALRGASLFIKKSQTAKTEDADTFFHYQLIGLEVFQGKEKIGNIESIQDFGATDLLEIKRDNKEILIPFTVQFVKEIDLENGTMQIEVPPELLDV
jgi:16S rRNA processing protein RimM